MVGSQIRKRHERVGSFFLVFTLGNMNFNTNNHFYSIYFKNQGGKLVQGCVVSNWSNYAKVFLECKVRVKT